ncbi:cobalt-precorrin-4/precorrin-4 C(11)-methyltransferase [Nocardia sp. NRRL S-836]|uniref:cobalt-precorrin-4/precorrin-4 C(11)-methyltransferase n=1 Tax=Nocardia sp. NRRL S-836 TaxID=1519492 RepID=UPI0006AEC40E|nr:cobalt-precorrin-4/precorrin-4 C(11)-methyltransferase [Nocardia sp. NRRL S-836]
MTTTGRVCFVGAGPGAADLITIRGARRIAEADVVIWAPSAVDAECVREHAREGADLVDFSRVTAEEITDLYRRAAASRLKVVRLHTGDAATGGGVQEQYDLCQRLGLEVEVVPGVSVVAAAAARIGREITLTEASSAVFLSPESSEGVREFAALGTTMAATVSGARTGQFVEELLEGGYSAETPVVVAYKVSQADELVVHTTVGELESVVKQHKLYRPTLFLVGSAVKATARRQSSTAAGTDEPARAARPTRWSRRAASRIATRVDEPVPTASGSPSGEPNPAWNAVEELQQSVRKPVDEAAQKDAAQKDSSKPKPKLTVVAAAMPKPPTVQASVPPKRKPTARKPKRAN